MKTRAVTLSTCVLAPGSVITVQLTDGGGRMFSRGDTVDLDALAAPDLTWRAAFGAYAETAFLIVDAAASQE